MLWYAFRILQVVLKTYSYSYSYSYSRYPTQKKIGALNVMKSAGSYVDIILEVYIQKYTKNIHFYTLPLVGGVNTTLPYTTPLGKILLYYLLLGNESIMITT